jgi:alpha-beta hydrolase superfamily lysophospholipase
MFEPDQPEVDIIAIHGINGHYLRTWTEGSSNWLRDFLPEDLPTARIMSLGYDSRVAFSSSVGNIDKFADQLLAYLNRERKEPTTQDRPIIFICHSMGGLVMKQVCYQPHFLSILCSRLMLYGSAI